MESSTRHLPQHPIHLGLGAVATVQPPFSGDVNWFADYTERVAADGNDGWLVSMYTFTDSWDVWEMHPNGHEIVVCTAGSVRLRQEHADGTTDTVELTVGDAAINPPGTWHTAEVEEPTTCVFITAGLGTEHRPC